jgi:hypothetical protein
MSAVLTQPLISRSVPYPIPLVSSSPWYAQQFWCRPRCPSWTITTLTVAVLLLLLCIVRCRPLLCDPSTHSLSSSTHTPIAPSDDQSPRMPPPDFGRCSACSIGFAGRRYTLLIEWHSRCGRDTVIVAWVLCPSCTSDSTCNPTRA